MRLIIHVGMGKTGTSSIQAALRTDRDGLARQGAAFLGMWFDAIAREFRGPEGMQRFYAADEAGMRAHAAALAAALSGRARKDGTTTFVMSNEDLFASVGRVAPFYEALGREVDLSFVCFVRPPADWLPSAFTQWSIVHKVEGGPIEPFPARARKLIGQYAALPTWAERFGDRLALRRFDKGTDVIAAFSEATGLALRDGGERVLERPEDAELLLRALFAERIEGPVVPQQFDGTVLPPRRRPAMDVEEMIGRCFDYAGIDAVVAERLQLFERIRALTGLDLLEGAGSPPPPPDSERLYRRLVDYLAETTLEQARRIRRLERIIEEREGGG